MAYLISILIYLTRLKTNDYQLKKKILFFVSEDWYFVSHRMDLCKYLIKNNFEIILLTNIKNHQKLIEECGIRVINAKFSRSKFNFFLDFLLIIKLFKIIINVRPNIIHNVAHKQILFGTFVGFFFKNLNILNAFAGMGFLFTQELKFSKKIIKFIIVFIYKFIFSLSKKNIYLVQNQEDKIFLINNLNINNNYIKIIKGSGINTNYYKRNTIKVTNDKIQVIMHSRILWDKGVKEYFDSHLIISKKTDKFNFILIGKNDILNPASVDSETLVNWNSYRNFEWKDYKSNIMEELINSDISVLPSYREGLPLSLLEDASCALGIIASDISGSNDIVINNFTGLLVPIKNSELLAAAILKLGNDNKLRSFLGSNARSHVKKNFSINVIAKIHIDLYNSLINEK